VRRHGLADRADVVALALDGEQHGAADRLGCTRRSRQSASAGYRDLMLKFPAML